MTRLSDDAGAGTCNARVGVRSGIDPTPHSLPASAAHPGGAGVIDPTPHSLPASAAHPGGAGVIDPIARFVVGKLPLADRLAEGLAVAKTCDSTTCIALPVTARADAAVVAAWTSAPMVVWSSGDTAMVGVGIARELRGEGAARYTKILEGARRIRIGTAIGHPTWVPRVFGGVAFAPEAADHAPWSGFGDAWFALPRWTYSNDGWLVLAVDADDATDQRRWLAELEIFEAALAHPFCQKMPPAIAAIDSGNRDAWHTSVRSIVSAIARGEYAKVVAARHARVTLAHEIRAADLLAELCGQHEECTRLLVRPGDTATLIAATPERLIRVTDTWIECDALAGSQPRSSADATSSDEAALLASAKDRREHALVVEAIVSQLRHLGCEVEASNEPTIRSLRHVLHLHTPIAARLAQKRHVLEFVEALHPTPAMGGTPTAAATAWIAAHEPARGWYASPVGWFDLEGNGEFAVAIRCGLVTNHRIDTPGSAGMRASARISRVHSDHVQSPIENPGSVGARNTADAPWKSPTGDQGAWSTIDVWAGAGIVSGSDPDCELAETEVKLRAILGALGVAR